MDGPVARAMRISVPETDLRDLRLRLASTRLPDQLKGTSWEYGMDKQYLVKLIDYWQHAFDWRKQVRASRWTSSTCMPFRAQTQYGRSQGGQLPSEARPARYLCPDSKRMCAQRRRP